jgi:short-subunit dehydrogenase
MSTSTKAKPSTGASGHRLIYADRLAHRGYDLIVARNQGRLTHSQRLCREVGRKIETVTADLNDKADLRRLKPCCAPPGITALVNNAGVGAGIVAGIEHRQDGRHDRIVGALTRLTYAAVPGFVARGGGTIINVASVVGIAPEVLNGVYGGTKAYVLALSLSLHKELADKNVRVQVVVPGATATDFWEIAGQPVEFLPAQIVMRADDMVDAALAGLDQGELVTIPSLPDATDWQSYEAARQKLMPNLSLSVPAARYETPFALRCNRDPPNPPVMKKP